MLRYLCDIRYDVAVLEANMNLDLLILVAVLRFAWSLRYSLRGPSRDKIIWDACLYPGRATPNKNETLTTS